MSDKENKDFNDFEDFFDNDNEDNSEFSELEGEDLGKSGEEDSATKEDFFGDADDPLSTLDGINESTTDSFSDSLDGSFDKGDFSFDDQGSDSSKDTYDQTSSFDDVESSSGKDRYRSVHQEMMDKTDHHVRKKSSTAKFFMIVVLGVIIFLGAGSVFFILSSDSEKELESDINTVSTDTTTVPTDTIVNEDPVELPSEDPQPSSFSPGTIDILTTRTGKYYVVIGSFLDEDFAKDYSKKISKGGNSLFVIVPEKKPGTDRNSFYRVCISQHETLALAVASAEDYKNVYGSDLWVVRF